VPGGPGRAVRVAPCVQKEPTVFRLRSNAIGELPTGRASKVTRNPLMSVRFAGCVSWREMLEKPPPSKLMSPENLTDSPSKSIAPDDSPPITPSTCEVHQMTHVKTKNLGINSVYKVMLMKATAYPIHSGGVKGGSLGLIVPLCPMRSNLRCRRRTPIPKLSVTEDHIRKALQEKASPSAWRIPNSPWPPYFTKRWRQPGGGGGIWHLGLVVQQLVPRGMNWAPQL
jgi:hypothetical protein